MTLTISDPQRHEVDIEIKLHINQKLFEKGYITEEMYESAKIIILKSWISRFYMIECI